MSVRHVIIFEGEAAQMLNRLCSRHSKSPDEMVHFAVNHLNFLLEGLAEGQSVVITKRMNETTLTVSDVLGDSSDLDGHGS